MFFKSPTADQALALSGVFQSAELVARIATHGDLPEHQFLNSMSVLLNQNPDSVINLYGSLSELDIGLNSMRSIITDRSSGSVDVMRYVIGILYLARRLTADVDKTKRVAKGISNAFQQAEHFSPCHDNVVANIAGLYTETVSTIQGRIQVSGNPDYLRQTAIAQRVRCLLFSGIRSAFLWQQLGGKRSHLLLHRNKLLTILPQ